MENLDIFNDLSEQIVLQINQCAEETHPSSWIESKQHVDYDLWYVFHGKIEIRIHNQVHLASAGDFVLFSPNVPYTATTSEDSCCFNFTHFDFGLGNHFRILENFQLAGIINSTLLPKETDLFLAAYKQYKLQQPMSGVRLKGCLMIFIAKMLALYHSGQYQGEFSYNLSGEKQTMTLQALQPVFSYIHDHLHQSLPIKKLAQLAGLSEKYFINYFKAALGITPGQYIYQLKMNRARELLYSHQFSIQQIADILGYADPYSFSKAFKKHYRVPPSKFI